MFSGLNLAHAKSTAAPPPFAELSSRCACSLDRCYWDILLLFSCPACVAGGPTFPWFGLPCHNKLSRCWLRCRPCFRFFAWHVRARLWEKVCTKPSIPRDAPPVPGAVSAHGPGLDLCSSGCASVLEGRWIFRKGGGHQISGNGGEWVSWFCCCWLSRRFFPAVGSLGCSLRA